MTKFNLFLRASLSVPLALVLAACGADAAEEVTLEGDPIAAIAAPDGAQWISAGLISPEGGNVMGNPDAPLKLVEYASHTCVACANFSQTASEPIKEYINTGVVSYEMRNLVRDPLDLAIARLVRCSTPEAHHALADQAWGEFDQIMTTAQQNGQAIQEAAIAQDFVGVAQNAGVLEFFAARGVSADQAKACLADTAGVMEIAERSDAQAKELGVDATPTFFLNGKKLEERTWPQIEALLQRAGARSAATTE